jgi:DNA-binding response OmpR family regulator
MSRKQTIWILEDEPGCRFVYQKTLELNYQLRYFETLSAFRETIHQTPDPVAAPDLVIADIRLPDAPFLDFFGSPEATLFAKVPFMVVSSVDDVDALRTCYRHGAGDYITKPFAKGELIVKVERILKGAEKRKDEIEIHPTSLTVSRGSCTSPALTPKEFQIIAILRGAPNRTLSRPDLYTEVWGQVSVGAKTLDAHIFNLRRKVEPLGLEISHVSPNLYRLVDLTAP